MRLRGMKSSSGPVSCRGTQQGVRRLLVVSHVIHFRDRGRLYAYGPYAREIDIWADLFPEVVIAAPCREEAPPGDCLAFTRPNIAMHPQCETGGRTLRAKAAQVVALPSLVRALSQAMSRADAIHVRCPGNLGLLGVLLAPLFSRYLVAKYAGQWNGYPGEPWTVRLQRALLCSPWWRGPVTVYGRWPGQPSKVIPFFTSVLTADQMVRALVAARHKRAGTPLRVLYVGRLSAPKNVDILLDALARLGTRGIKTACMIVGEGQQRRALEARAAALGLDDGVQFAGGVPFAQVLDCYEQADVLVLASESEGWPKAIAEAMAFGLICVGSNRGLVPWMLGDGRGVLVPPGDADALARALLGVALAPEEYEGVRTRAVAWAHRYSLEGLEDALAELLTAHWGIEIRASGCSPEKQARGTCP